MDSKKRHELEQNLLAKWLASQYEDWIRPNSGWLGYAVLGVLIAVTVIIVTKQVNTWNQNAAWKQYYAALHSEQADAELELVAQSTKGIVGAHARLALAQRQLAKGCSLVLSNKKESIVLLEQALDSFRQVQKATSDASILQKAGLGLGQCWETLAAARIGNDLAEAEKEYQNVIDRWKEGYAVKQAQGRLTRIRQPATKEFLELTAAKTEEEPVTDDFLTNRSGWNDPLVSQPFDIIPVAPETITDEQEIEILETESETEPEIEPNTESATEMQSETE